VRGAEAKRRSHSATAPPEAPVAAMLGLEGWTSRQSSCRHWYNNTQQASATGAAGGWEGLVVL